MRFSTFILPNTYGPHEDADAIALTRDRAVWADGNGFSGIFLAEHHTTALAAVGESLQFGAYLASQLKHATLGFSIVVVPYHHPVRLVQRINLIDQLTKGKAMFVVGSGNREVQESLSAGIEVNEATSGMFEENFAIARQLWAKKIDDDPVVFETKYYRGAVVERVAPSPYGALKLMGVGMRDASIIRSADNGWPPLVFAMDGRFGQRLRAYRARLATAGHTSKVQSHCMDWTTHIAPLVIVADTDAKAEAARAQLPGEIGIDQDHLAKFRRRSLELVPDAPMPTRHDFKAGDGPPPPLPLVGSPDTVAERLKPFAALGVGNVMVSFPTAVDPTVREIGERSMRLFAEEVMPRFAGASTPGDPLAIPLDELALEPVTP